MKLMETIISSQQACICPHCFEPIDHSIYLKDTGFYTCYECRESFYYKINEIKITLYQTSKIDISDKENKNA